MLKNKVAHQNDIATDPAKSAAACCHFVAIGLINGGLPLRMFTGPDGPPSPRSALSLWRKRGEAEKEGRGKTHAARVAK